MRWSYRPLREKPEPRRCGPEAGVMAEKFRGIFEASPDYIIVARLEDGRIAEANPGFELLSGWPVEEVIGRTVLELGLWEHPEERQSLVRRLRREGVVRNYPILFRRKDGLLRHTLASLRLFPLAGQPHYVAILRDVTDEECMRRALTTAETRFRTIFETTPHAIALNRCSDLAFLDLNPAYERIFGYCAAELIGKTVPQIGFVLGDLPAFRDQTRRLFKLGYVDNEEASLQRRDGRWVSFLYSSRLVDFDDEKVIVTVAVDVTRQKQIEDDMRQTEEALRESEMRFSTLFGSSPIALGVFGDASSNYSALQFNDAWYRLFGYRPEQVIGKATSEFSFQVNPPDRARILDLLEKQGEAHDFECWLYRADGEKLLCQLFVRKLLVGSRLLILAAYMDITRQRETEEALYDLNVTLEYRIQQRSQELQRAQAELMRSEKLASLGSLVAGVAHELNTPIGNSLMVASTLAESTEHLVASLDSGIRRSVLENYLANASAGSQIIVRSLTRSADLIQNFKSIAVDQSNDQRRSFDLGKIVAETLGIFELSRKNKGFAVQAEVEDGLMMNSYPGQIEQVLINLVNNALLHAFSGRDAGTVSIRAVADGPDRVRLSVEDDGVGIAPENLPRVFDPFFTTRLGQGGSGLGLSIVLSIVENVLGGQIHTESHPGQGTRFRMDLPRQAPGED